ncbi:RES domain-containing protein [Modicisalibacter ilicicola DSM 19980]|uniref:RES domain-containing protein n=1 Tax=Modicisalibacter ilicicola DSM 19980 TaxID=1121942 RepID=A0A1M4ZZR5_9GAMM|nr:RES family NAD+ phosphorylase [Halomonas ilicicola]SHF23212.1 RES domain-containing protein [Halomonas ilicicola DSM 19980]
MAKTDEPLSLEELRALTPVIITREKGEQVYRLFFAGGEHPSTWDAFRHFGPTASRFDHHLPDDQGEAREQSRGIMYLAAGSQAIPTCLAEVFQAARVIDTRSRAPVLCCFALEADLNLLDLTGAFATRLHASTIGGCDRALARRWAQRLYDAYPDANGILYTSSMYPGRPAIALFERGASAIAPRPLFHRQLQDLALTSVIERTAQRIGYLVV